MSDATNYCCADSALCTEQGLGAIGGGEGNCHTPNPQKQGQQQHGLGGVAGVGGHTAGGLRGNTIGGGGGGDGGPGPESIYTYVYVCVCICIYIYIHTRIGDKFCETPRTRVV